MGILGEGVGEAGVVEEELLGVAAGGAEVGAGEIAEGAGGGFGLVGEVELAQDAFDPDVDGESGKALPAEEEGTVGDFFADAVKLAEGGAGLGVGEGGDGVEVEVAVGDGGGGAMEEGGAVSEAAGAEGGFAGGGEGLGAWVGGLEGEAGGRAGLAEAVAEGKGDFADVGDLFEGGGDEGGEALPGGLADEAEAWAPVHGAAEGEVVGREGGGEGGEVVVEAEVVADEGGAAGGDEEELGAGLGDPDGDVADEAGPAVLVGMPVKDLAALEGGPEVEGVVGEGEGGGLHGWGERV